MAVEGSVNQAFADAQACFAQAQRADRDLALWAEARAAAKQAKERAAEAQAGPDVQERIRRLLAEVEQLEKNRLLVETLRGIHAGMGDNLTPSGDQDFAGANERYAQAFRAHGTDLLAASPQEGAEVLRNLSGNVGVQLAAAIDDWVYVRFVMATLKMAPDDGHRLFQVTRLLDPDPVRNQIRDLVAARDSAALEQLAETIEPASQPVQTVNMVPIYLYWFLQHAGGTKTATRFLRKAHPHHTGDFQINHNLAFFLKMDGLASQALPYAAAAVALRPESASAWLDYTWVLADLKRTEEAIVACRRVGSLAPQSTAPRHTLIDLLTRTGDGDGVKAVRGELVEIYREQLRLNPKNGAAHAQLGAVLADQGDLPGAMAEYREAVRIAPYYGTVSASLWHALMKTNSRVGKSADDALLATFEEMTRLNPRSSWPHLNLGNVRMNEKDAKRAVPAFQEALRFDPQDAWPHCQLGTVLRGMKDLPGAIAAYRDAARSDPKSIRAHELLAHTLYAAGDLDESAATYHKVQELEPRNPAVANLLGLFQRGRGDLDAAIVAFKEAIKLNPADTAVQETLRQTERWKSLLPELNFAGGPRPQPDHRYLAACRAVGAAAGKGKDSATLPAGDRAALRSLALTWLRADLRLLQKRAASARPSERQEAVTLLTKWLRDTALDEARPGARREGWTMDEAAAWDRFWSDAAKFRDEASGMVPPEK
jgi:tetratricopeptide (TPR) repeat protein